MTETSGALSRRTVLLGAVALAGLAGCGRAVAGNPTVPPPAGKLVPQLLAADPFSVAHRGGSADWPEMSLYAYQQSVVRGINAVEISLARTSDGVWFGLHDETLDRTSGTSGFRAADHTWAEVQQYRINPPAGRKDQGPQPYLRFDDLVAAYGSTHSIFVDPKFAGPTYAAELLSLMVKLVPAAASTFIAKGYCASTSWASAATAQGLRTWGYFYGAEIAATPELFTKNVGAWSALGLDVAATPEQWAQFTATGKPLIGHIVGSPEAADSALRDGAHGLMISAVAEVVQRW